MVFHRENVESVEGRRLLPMDQHGVVLGSECIKQWPQWLPKDWRIGYYKSSAGAATCLEFLSGSHGAGDASFVLR